MHHRNTREAFRVKSLVAVILAGVGLATLTGCGSQQQVKCDGVVYKSYKAAWSHTTTQYCEGHVTGPIRKNERKAIEVAYKNPGSDWDFMRNTLYGMCAWNGSSSKWSYLAKGYEATRSEANGMLTLCPDHPQASYIKSLTLSG